MSAIALFFPTMRIGVGDCDFLAHCRSERKRISLAAGSDVEVLHLCSHATSDLFSQNLPMCLNIKSSTTYYITIHPRTNPTNSRLFIVNLPFGFV